MDFSLLPIVPTIGMPDINNIIYQNKRKNMRYRVGLDVGTASLGVAAFSLDENNNPIDLIWKHVRVFDEPLEKSQAGLKSKKAGRRENRMQRRQIDRRLGRTKSIASLAKLLNIEILPSIDSGSFLPEIRARAVREQIELADLIRVFIRIGKRRGYAGEFRPKKVGAKLGEVEGGSHDLKQEMNALANAKGYEYVTLGEYLYQRWLESKPTKLKIKEPDDKDTEGKNLYALRSDLLFEFDQIWEKQSTYYPIMQGVNNGKTLKAIFQETIFHQRPLKAVSGMVGQCSLESTHPRSPRAQPAFQSFRIEKTLSDLRWGAGKRAEMLSAEQKSIIRQLCDKKEAVKFETIYQALEEEGYPKPLTKGLNLDRLSRDEIPGNKTNAVFRKLKLEDDWLSLNELTQIQVINFLADLGSPEQLDATDWHLRFAKSDGTPRQLPDKFVQFINLLKSHEKFDRLSKMGFEGARASYSIKALKRLTEWLKSPNWPIDWHGQIHPDEDSAIRVCYPKNIRKTSLSNELGPVSSSGNSVVDGSLRQIRFVFNRMIKDIGDIPEQIVVEMAREMSVGITKRNERESENNKNRKARLEAEKEIREHGVTVTSSRIRRYLLWVEQGKGHCPYCSKKIDLGDALNGAETEYEHIIPKSLTQVGLKRSEIVLAHRSCNYQKGDSTPYQVWGHDAERWQIIQNRAKFFYDNKLFRKAKLLLIEDFETEVLTDESIDGFSDRQFHQTSWIAKVAAQWLQTVSKTPVSVSRGELTSMLRRQWKLETVIPEVRAEEGLPILDEDENVISVEDFKRFRDVWEGHRVIDSKGNIDKTRYTDRKLNKRIDHRHHLVDAITIGLTSRRLFQDMARQYKADTERAVRGMKPRLMVAEPPIKNIRLIAVNAIRECPLSIKPDRYPDGAMFQKTAYGVALKEGEERERLTLRCKIANLVDRKKGTLEQARKAIISIVNSQLREIVSSEFEKRIAMGKTVAEALSTPIYHDILGKKMQIKKVRCFTEKYAKDVTVIKHTSKDGRTHEKRLMNDGYSYLELETDNGKIIKYKLVNTHDGMRNKNKPVNANTTRFYKNDSVIDSKDGKRFRIGYFNADGNDYLGNVHLVPIVDPRAFDAIKEKNSGKRKISFSQLLRLQLIH